MQGLGYVHEQQQNKENRFLYNGKEKTSELGLEMYEFGARMYDGQIGRWQVVDRFAEKYFDLSPYQYCANNPIMLIDINGDSLWIRHRIGFLGLAGKETLLYQDGHLYNKDGSAYTGKVKGFLSKTVNALNIIRQTQEGGSMVSELQSSDNHFTIIRTFGKNKFTPNNTAKAYANQIQTDPAQAAVLKMHQTAGISLAGGWSGGTIAWKTSGVVLPTLKGSGVNATTDLGHELFHGLDANRGLLDDRQEQGIERSEWQAVYRENLLRSELGVPLRTHYTKIVDENYQFVGGTGVRFLNSVNQPILPHWYNH